MPPNARSPDGSRQGDAAGLRGTSRIRRESQAAHRPRAPARYPRAGVAGSPAAGTGNLAATCRGLRVRHRTGSELESVVLGKSVSLRVDLGGTRILQTQQTQKNAEHITYTPTH